MKAKFENKNLVNFTGMVSVDKDGHPKVYRSLKLVNKSAEKLNAKVLSRGKIYLIVL